MRFFYSLALAALVAAPLAAQPSSYSVVASQEDLADGGTLPGAVPSCIVAVSPPGPAATILFFDAASGMLATYDEGAAPGARTTVVATAAELDASAGAPVTVCRDAGAAIGAVSGVAEYPVFLALSDADNADRVLRLDADGTLTRLTDPGSASDAGDGVSGLATFDPPGPTEPGLYLARVAAFGAPEDGIYRLNLDGADQTPTAVVTDPDLDLVGLAASFQLGLVAVSSEFGEGERANVVLSADPTDDPVTLGVVERPCDGNDAVFTDCTDGGLEAVEILPVFAGDSFGEVPVVFNNSFSGPDGETAAALFGGGRQFTESGLVAATGIAGYTTAGSNGYLALAFPENFGSGGVAPRILVAGSDAFGGTPGIYAVDAPFGVASEQAPVNASLVLTVGPNPSRGAVRVALMLSAPTAVRVDVVDALGRHVETLHDGAVAGNVSFTFDASSLAGGVYYVTSTSETGRVVTPFTVLR